MSMNNTMASQISHSDGIPVTVDDSATTDGNDAQVYLPAEYYQPFLSVAAKQRRPSPIRGLLPLESTPGMISLLAGKPNPTMFPFTSFTFTARSPFEPSKDTEISLDQDALTESLQYTATSGIPSLLGWLDGLQERMHGRKKEKNWKISVGCGSQDLIYKAIYAMVNPGDCVLVESPVYAGVIPIFQCLNCDQIEVETDAHGISSSSLAKILNEWPTGKQKPRVLYTTPYGCNPTGMTSTLERRREVLSLARKHEFIILEDDPYFFIYYGQAPRYPSYFSLELEASEQSKSGHAEQAVGRVLRFDSFSKVLSAGMRLGLVSGPTALVNAIDLHTAASNLQPPSLTQAIAFALVNSWGYEGFIKHTELVAQFYREKRDVFSKALKEHLTGLAEWTDPEAGMFYWFKLLDSDPSSAGDSEKIIRTHAFQKGVLALPGTVFLPNGRKTGYVRAAFSLAPPKDVDVALRRLREAILEVQNSTIA